MPLDQLATLASLPTIASPVFTPALYARTLLGTNCNHILAAKACGAICSTISDTSTELVSLPVAYAPIAIVILRRIALVGLEVLWNILEHGPQLQV